MRFLLQQVSSPAFSWDFPMIPQGCIPWFKFWPWIPGMPLLDPYKGGGGLVDCVAMSEKGCAQTQHTAMMVNLGWILNSRSVGRSVWEVLGTETSYFQAEIGKVWSTSENWREQRHTVSQAWMEVVVRWYFFFWGRGEGFPLTAVCLFCAIW